MKIKYYSLWRDSREIINNGASVSFHDLTRKFELPADVIDLSKDINKSASYYLVKPKELKKLFDAVVYSVSGHRMHSQDEDRLKRVTQEIARKSKQADNFYRCGLESPNFLFGCLPYMFIGFDSKRRSSPGKDGVNSDDNFYEVLNLLNSGGKIKISSFLCTHKERREIDPDKLRKQIKFSDVSRVINLMSGILDNSTVESAEIRFFQPTGSYSSASYIFPQIIMSYLGDGMLGDMLVRLDDHSSTMKEYISRFESPRRRFISSSIDSLVTQTNFEARKRFGDDWKKMPEDLILGLAGGTCGKAIDTIAEVAYFMTQKEVERLMPFYSNPISIDEKIIQTNLQNARRLGDEVGNKNLELDVNKIINSLNETMSIYGRAVYETLFYYMWGRNAGKSDEIGFGLDTDHEMFQTAAWDIGWKESIEQEMNISKKKSPLLYSRKAEDGKEGEFLNNMSFRQFWR